MTSYRLPPKYVEYRKAYDIWENNFFIGNLNPADPIDKALIEQIHGMIDQYFKYRRIGVDNMEMFHDLYSNKLALLEYQFFQLAVLEKEYQEFHNMMTYTDVRNTGDSTQKTTNKNVQDSTNTNTSHSTVGTTYNGTSKTTQDSTQDSTNKNTTDNIVNTTSNTKTTNENTVSTASTLSLLIAYNNASVPVTVLPESSTKLPTLENDWLIRRMA